MDKMMSLAGVTPTPSATIGRFMAVYDELCSTVDDEVRGRGLRRALGLAVVLSPDGGGVVPRPLSH